MASSYTSRHHTAQQERMVQKQASPDFLDPMHGRRRLFALLNLALYSIYPVWA